MICLILQNYYWTISATRVQQPHIEVCVIECPASRLERHPLYLCFRQFFLLRLLLGNRHRLRHVFTFDSLEGFAHEGSTVAQITLFLQLLFVVSQLSFESRIRTDNPSFRSDEAQCFCERPLVLLHQIGAHNACRLDYPTQLPLRCLQHNAQTH